MATNNLRLLDVDKDKDLLIEAYDWRLTAPAWFRKCLDIFKETKEEYLENAKDEMHFGVFEDEEMKAVIRLVQDRPGVLNIHLSAKKGADIEMILAAGETLRDLLFEKGVQSFFGYLPTLNKGISKLYEALGFHDTGIRVYKGQIHNKVVCFRHYFLANPR